MKEIEFNVVKNIGVIGNKGDWSFELNLVSWNKNNPKFDLRSWTDDHKKMSKGVTLTKEEMLSLKELLNKINIEEEIDNSNN